MADYQIADAIHALAKAVENAMKEYIAFKEHELKLKQMKGILPG